MPSSGTVGSTVYRAADLIDSIAKRCGVPPATLSPEGLDTITGTLWRLLASWSNRGINLWRLYHALIPIYSGKQVYQLAQGDIDTMNVIHRQPQRLSASAVTSSGGGTVANLTDGDVSTACTQGGANGNFVFDWGAGTTYQVGMIGLMSSPARSYNLVMEISNDNAQWAPVLAPGAVAYAANGWQWYEIDPTGIPARYFRVRETGGAVMSFNEISLAVNWTDVDISRWNLDQWSTNPSKRSTGTPRQYYMERLLTPQINLWPVPASMESLNLMCVWIHRHIEDVGVISNTLNIPQRWYQPLIDMASFTCLPELPGADLKRYDMLKDIAMNISLPDAEKEERDKGPIHLAPMIGVYTR